MELITCEQNPADLHVQIFPNKMGERGRGRKNIPEAPCTLRNGPRYFISPDLDFPRVFVRIKGLKLTEGFNFLKGRVLAEH